MINSASDLEYCHNCSLKGGARSILERINNVAFAWCMIKIFLGGQGWWHLQNPIPPYEQLLPLPTPCFKMFLERSLNDPHPPPPHFKHLSLLPPSPSTTPSPPKKFNRAPDTSRTSHLMNAKQPRSTEPTMKTSRSNSLLTLKCELLFHGIIPLIVYTDDWFYSNFN